MNGDAIQNKPHMKADDIEKNIRANLEQILERRAKACQAAGRKEGTVRILLAVKTQPAGVIRTALELGKSYGITMIGENRVQEALGKMNDLSAIRVHTPFEFHFIGHLQSNKVKDVLKFADCIQSIDRLDTAEKLARRLSDGISGQNKEKYPVFVEINTSGETAKSGVPPAQALSFLSKLREYSQFHVKGLMTIGALSDDPKDASRCFSLLAEIAEKYNSQTAPGGGITDLSMGMSHDMEEAIHCGATILRIGTAVFGKRPDTK